MTNRLSALAILVVFLAGLSGCGQTIRGMGDDIRRVGTGVRTIFVAE